MPAKNQITSPCVYCGALVSKSPSKINGRMFCGWDCYDAQRQAESLVTKPCEGCGAPVTRKGKHKKAHTFCSRECYLSSPFHSTAVSASNDKRFAGRRRSEPCARCGVIVEKPQSLMTSKMIFCSRMCSKAYAIEHPVRQVARGGYVKVFVGVGTSGALASGHVLEHRWVMQEKLGRPLLKHENVHHINGVRTDNRLENLELWSTSQPSGQRVEDKIRWAREFLALYEGSPLM